MKLNNSYHRDPEYFGITKYSWVNGLLNVDQDVDLDSIKLLKIPFNFGEVKGDFNCQNNRLTSLRGCPIKVSGNFDCSQNRLETLRKMPNIILGDFYFDQNKFKKINILAEVINGHFNHGRKYSLNLSLINFLAYTYKYPLFYKNVDIVENPDRQTTIDNLKKKMLISKLVENS